MANDEEFADGRTHGRRATDRGMRSTPFRFDWGVSFGQALLIVPLIVGVTTYIVNTNAQSEQNKQQSAANQAQVDKLRIDVTAQITDFKKDVAGQFQNQQSSNTAAFATLAAAIANVPNISAALPEMRSRIERMEQERAALSTRLDIVQAKGVETEAQLHAALQAGIEAQRRGR